MQHAFLYAQSTAAEFCAQLCVRSDRVNHFPRINGHDNGHLARKLTRNRAQLSVACVPVENRRLEIKYSPAPGAQLRNEKLLPPTTDELARLPAPSLREHGSVTLEYTR